MKRILLTCATGALVAAGPASGQEVVGFASYGGAYQEGLRGAMLNPIMADHSDIRIRDYTVSGGIAEVRTQVAAGAVEWDVVELYAGQCQQAANEGLLVPLDYGIITNTGGIPDELIQEHWLGFTAYSTVMAWNTDVYGDNPPQGWADFFDTGNFPGARAMSSTSIAANAEIALLAAGVPRDELYPIDLDLALETLDRLKPDIAVWWSTGAQATQLAQSEEVEMLSIWTARIEAAIADGAPFAYTMQDAIMDVECLVVPRGSPNPEGAMRLINLLVAPEYQANLPEFLPYGPMNQDAFATGKISPEAAARVITSEENLPKHVILNKAFWAEHGQAAQERWDAFKQE